MRSRAAILPFPGDPFLLNYWLSFYDNVWGKEVDKLYIYANSSIEDEVWQYIIDRCSRSKNVYLIIEYQQREHGYCIDKTLDVVKEDYVVLLEDDCFIFKPGHINECFKLLESGRVDVVGSKRGSCSFEILDRAKEYWGLNYEGLGDQGCNFWPNLLFTKTDILRNTSRQFGATHWNAGEYCEPLDYTFKVEAAGDTFVKTSLELRAKGYKIVYVPQYHASPDDLQDYEARRFLFDGYAPWVHMGSLSSGLSGLIRDQWNRPLSKRQQMEKEEAVVLPSHCNSEMERREFERRVTCWLTAWEKREQGKIDEFSRAYFEGLERIIAQFQLNRGNIKRRKAIYKQLGL